MLVHFTLLVRGFGVHDVPTTNLGLIFTIERIMHADVYLRGQSAYIYYGRLRI